MTRKTLGWGMALAVAVVVVGALGFRPQTVAQTATGPASAGPKYTVVETEGTNLVVVDNARSVLYFYTVEPGQEVGHDLHLRGSLDLTEVGKPVLKPKKVGK